MSKIYIVTGETGEYSDRREWFVRAFVSESRAAELVVAATKRAAELQAEEWRSWKGEFPNHPNEHDPDMDMDYTGTSYRLDAVELDETP